MTRDSQVRNSGALWTLLSNMRIEDPGAARSFEQALAEDRGWPEDHARAVAGEYRRFLYLAATSDGPATPSIAVDAAWHLHLTYSRHYWTVLCGEILGRPLHHEPSAGGLDEDARHRAQYEATLRRYEAVFLDPAPPSIWPRLNSEPEPELEHAPGRSASVTVGLAGLAVAAVIAAAGAPPVYGVALVCVAVGLGLAALFPRRTNRNGSGGCAGGGDASGGCVSGCGSGCGGGCGGD
ncbi:MAG TPA: hypothetical protein VEW25_02445 [Allosphingosinicella sp.]|nr:hypothetical protein [Allosphingosinicella sp.]